MEKDSLSTVALIGLLLIMIVVALYVKKEQELLVTKPDVKTVVAQVLADQTTTESQCDQSCPTPTPTPSQKDKWRQDPVPKIKEELEKKFAKEIEGEQIRTAFFVKDQVWWRSEKENYRILVDQAKVFGMQVPTTTKASELAAKNPGQDPHPANRHPQLKKAIREINKQMGDLGYKKDQFKECPVSEAYDSFNNCVATFTKDQQKCSLIAGYGTLEKSGTDQSQLRIELACSNQYEAAYQAAQPYLMTLNTINPEWRVPDMAVYQIAKNGVWSKVSFGTNQAIFEKVSEGYRLVDGGPKLNCDKMWEAKVPQTVYENCQ